MWCRKRIDIGWSDLALGVFGVCFRYDRTAQEAAIAEAWPAAGRELVSCLSVRSGWDLLLQSLALPAGSEVLMSAMTIPDMAAIVKAHDLIPVPLELEPSLAGPTPEILRQAITPRSKIVLIAHLFGNRLDLSPHIRIAREHGLLFVEDCAQAYAGTKYPGHTEADVSMFSFGNIKTRTALGGGVLHLKDRELAKAINLRQEDYPLQSRGPYFQRLLKHGGLKFLSTYPVFSAFTRICGLLGVDLNNLLNRSVRGFASTEGLERFRQKPCAPLLALLARRLRGEGSKRLDRQIALGNRLLEQIRSAVECPGGGADYHHFWVFPVLADQPHELMDFLRGHGFDATQGESMRIIEKPANSPAAEPSAAAGLLDRMVYVPMYAELSDRAVDKLAKVLVRYFEEQESRNQDLLDIHHN